MVTLVGEPWLGNLDFLKGVDQNTIKLWMDNYCSSRPLELTGDAADALSIELKIESTNDPIRTNFPTR
jgi:hypothetical protein